MREHKEVVEKATETQRILLEAAVRFVAAISAHPILLRLAAFFLLHAGMGLTPAQVGAALRSDRVRVLRNRCPGASVIGVRVERNTHLGVVAHDLRNPLNGVTLWAKAMHSALARGRTADPEGPEMILRAAKRMNRMISDLLDLASLDAGTLAIHRGRVAPAGLLAELHGSQAPLAEEASVELRLAPHGALPDVWADPSRLLQVFENLVTNAIKFTPAGGRVTLGAEVRGDEVQFSVADTGPGVPPDQLPHLFNRFWQADRNDRRGAGLGLAIVKGILEAHGGRIWAESRLGEGTTVSFTAPLAREDEA